MIYTKIVAALIAAALLLSSSPTPDLGATPQVASMPIVLGYYTDQSDGSLKQYHSQFNLLATDTLNTDGNGNLVGSTPMQALKKADQYGIKAYALVSNYGEKGWDGQIAHQVLNNPTVKAQLIANMIKTVRNHDYIGINIDFEEVVPEDRQALSLFVRDTATEMRKYGKKTMVSVPAKTEDDIQNGWSGAFDYKKIGRYADLVQVMTYDEHGMWSEPGSAAGLSWIDASLKFAVTKVSPSKLLAGVPAYGNDWNLSDPSDESGGMMAWKNIRKLIREQSLTGKRDPQSKSMKAAYQADDGDRHVVWYEDAYSIKLKAQLVKKYRLAGISVYALGMEDAAFWSALQAGLK
ncbi:glycosyl hydrolase family 18 protein [Saccharibacillus sp. JS10]|uniref:glycosyl hydrolase family 18 protein n=1 Tax=Saccharibacillus sp. JS10 TaxID=2950552 RepID=UPI00210CA2E1|nr:glycosyl hydrolase family 18 protein [Saccharibacillus sp. JS10]MCQ4087961.1 glycosyl hydrolase family 18 protein [Saccharibacillus sp. JS10]